MIAPPVGAGPLSVAVPRELTPPRTLVGETVKLATVGSGGFSVSAANAEVPAYVAYTDAVVAFVTAVVVMLKLAVVPPTGMMFWMGGIACVLVELNVMRAPPAGAGPFNVAVPREMAPPITVLGETVNVVMKGG